MDRLHLALKLMELIFRAINHTSCLLKRDKRFGSVPKSRKGKLSTPILVMGESQSSNRLRFKMWVRGFAMI